MKFFTKPVKSLISLALCILMLSSFCLPVFAAPASFEVGLVELRDQFRRGTSSDEVYGMKYCSFNPTDYNEEGTKYPVVVFLGENDTDGTDSGKELKTTEFPYWSSAEYQKRFYNAGGAHLIFPKLPRDIGSMATNSIVTSVKKLLNEYIEKNASSVDAKRIYIVSWSTGCKYAVKLISEYRGFFKAIALISPEYEIKSDEYVALSEVPAWLFACRSDANFGKYGEAAWSGIKDGNRDPYKIRYTRYDTYSESSTIYAAHDLDKNFPGVSSLSTINGRGIEVSFGDNGDGLISWLSIQGSDYGADCDCDCHHATGFDRLLWLLLILISMMFKIEKNRVCKCGVAHY